MVINNSKQEARLPVLLAILLILFIVLTPIQNIIYFILYFSLILFTILIKKLPLLTILQRSTIILPFVLFMAIFLPFLADSGHYLTLKLLFFNLKLSLHGLQLLSNSLLKAWLSTLVMTSLLLSLGFPNIINSLDKLGVPRLFVLLISFMYRYMFVLKEEAFRMETSRNLRYFGTNKRQQIKVFANMIGILFIRTYELAEQIYQSMCCRGYESQTAVYSKKPFFNKASLAYMSVVSIVLLLLLLWI